MQAPWSLSNDARGLSQLMLLTLDHKLDDAKALARTDPTEVFKLSTAGNLIGLNWLHLVAHNTTKHFGVNTLAVEDPTS